MSKTSSTKMMFTKESINTEIINLCNLINASSSSLRDYIKSGIKDLLKIRCIMEDNNYILGNLQVTILNNDNIDIITSAELIEVKKDITDWIGL